MRSGSADDTIVHVVGAGEHLYGIALQYGMDAAQIWSHPQNAGLAKAGRTPSVLAPGDVLFVPKPERKFLPVKLGAVNELVATPPTASVSFRLSGPDGHPLAGEPYEAPELAQTGASDGRGTITLKNVPVTTTQVLVKLTKRDLDVRVDVGHLDPVTTERGQAQRLAHLGYLPQGGIRPSPESVALALQRFVLAVAPDAQTDEQIQQALLDAHAG